MEIEGKVEATWNFTWHSQTNVEHEIHSNHIYMAAGKKPKKWFEILQPRQFASVSPGNLNHSKFTTQ